MGKGYRTYIYFALVILAGLADLIPALKEYLPANYYAYLAFAAAVGGLVLRTVTTTPPRQAA